MVGQRMTAGWVHVAVVVVLTAAACTSSRSEPSPLTEPSSESVVDGGASTTELVLAGTPMEGDDSTARIGQELVLIGGTAINRGDTLVIDATHCYSPLMMMSLNLGGRAISVVKYLEVSEEAPRRISMRVPASVDVGDYTFGVWCSDDGDVSSHRHRLTISVAGPAGPTVPDGGVELEAEPSAVCWFTELENSTSDTLCEVLSPYPDRVPADLRR